MTLASQTKAALWVRRIARNVILGLILFAAAVTLDYAGIQEPSVEVEWLVMLPLGFLFQFGMPVLFWYVNRGEFRESPRGELYRILLAIGLTALWWGVFVLPLLEVHTTMGGTL